MTNDQFLALWFVGMAVVCRLEVGYKQIAFERLCWLAWVAFLTAAVFEFVVVAAHG